MAARKLASLIAAGARVRLVSPELAPETREQTGDEKVELLERGLPNGRPGGGLAGGLRHQRRDPQPGGGPPRPRRPGFFVNVVDVPPLCSFIVPAVVRRGELTVAVSTGGASPAAARRLRQRLEGEFGPEWGPYLALLRAARNRLTALGCPAAQNRTMFYKLVDSELFQRVAAGDSAGVEAVLARELGPGFSLAELGLDPRGPGPGREADPVSTVLHWATLIAYVAGGLVSLAYLAKQRPGLHRMGLAVLWVGFGLHTAALAAAWVQEGMLPAANLRQSLDLFSWAVMGAALVVNLRLEMKIMGAVAGPLCALLLMSAAVLPKVQGVHQPGLQEPVGRLPRADHHGRLRPAGPHLPGRGALSHPGPRP